VNTREIRDSDGSRRNGLEQLRARVRQFAADGNEHWLLERHGQRAPRQARDALRQPAMA
jgi:hypothetical protein